MCTGYSFLRSDLVSWDLSLIKETEEYDKEKKMRWKYIAIYDSLKAYAEPFDKMKFYPTPEN